MGDATSVGSDGLPPRNVFVAQVDLLEPTVVQVWTDRKLSPFPTRYTINLNGILQDITLDPLLVFSAPFLGLQAGTPTPTRDNTISNADIANPQTLSGALDPLSLPTDSVLGTYPIDDTGDVAKDEGLASYKKRVLRRLSTRKGKFAHLPGYGTLAFESLKKLGLPAAYQQIAADAEAQIREEPETVAVQVKVTMQGGVAFYRIRVRCTFGATFDMTAPIQISG